jgi:hypothetical protein
VWDSRKSSLPRSPVVPKRTCQRVGYDDGNVPSSSELLVLSEVEERAETKKSGGGGGGGY